MKIRSRAATAVGFVAVVTVVCLGVLAVSSPVDAQAPQMVEPKALPDVVSGPYKVAVGDVLEINFFKATQMSTTRTVGPDGEIYLPLVGRVAVMDRTVDDITEELNTRYSEEMVNPQITVSVSQYSGLKVYVGGEVNFPAMHEYRGGLTLVQAIMNAGGFKNTGRQKEVVLIRRSQDGTPAGTVVDCKSILRGYQVDRDVELAPYDIVYVPRKHIADVNLFVEQYINSNIPRVEGWWWWFQDDNND